MNKHTTVYRYHFRTLCSARNDYERELQVCESTWRALPDGSCVCIDAGEWESIPEVDEEQPGFVAQDPAESLAELNGVSTPQEGMIDLNLTAIEMPPLPPGSHEWLKEQQDVEDLGPPQYPWPVESDEGR